MGLIEKRKQFFKIRSKCRILVKSHAFLDYPERGFSKMEIVNLVKSGSGRVKENTSIEAIFESFLFIVKDDSGLECKLVILIEEVEIEQQSSGGAIKEMVIVCSAYRSTR